MQLQKHITEHLEEITGDLMDKAGVDGSDKLQISRVDLVFDNNNLISLLRKRGRAIMYEDKNQVQKYEDILNNKEYKDRQYFCKVVGVFVTYERKDDLMNIHKASKKKTKFLGKKTKIRQADQPYNYIWENMAYTKTRRCCGFMWSMLILTFFLLIAFTIQFKMQKTVSYFDNYEKADCNVYKDSVAVATGEQVKTPSIYIIEGFNEVRF